MKNRAFAIVFAFFSLTAFTQTRTTTGIGERVLAIEALGPRTEGSPGLEKLLSLIVSEALGPNSRVLSSRFSGNRLSHSFSGMVTVDLEGETDSTLVILIPACSRQGARRGMDGALGVALGLELLERYTLTRPPLRLRLIFSGAEYGFQSDEIMQDGPAARLGTHAALENLSGRAAALYLDMPGASSSYGLLFSSQGRLSPFWLYDRTLSTLGIGSFPLEDAPHRMVLARFGFADADSPLAPWFDANIPAIGIVPQPGTGHASMDDFSALLDGICSFVEASRSGFPESWDRQYLVFSVGGKRIVIRETAYLIVMLCLSGLIIAGYAFLSIRRREAFKRSIKLAPRSSLLFIAALLILFFTVMGLSLLFGAIQASYAPSGFWAQALRQEFLIRIIEIFAMFTVVMTLAVLSGIMPANPTFYETVALSILIIDIFVFSSLQLALSMFFLWAFAWALVAKLLRRPWVNFAVMPLAVAPLFIVVAEFFRQPIESLSQAMIAPELAQGLMFSVILFPFFMMYLGAFFSLTGERARGKMIGFSLALTLLLVSIVFEHTSAMKLAKSSSPRIHLLERSGDGLSTAELTLVSRFPLPAMSMERGGIRQDVKASVQGNFRSTVPATVAGPQLSLKSRRVLDRTIVSLVIRSFAAPYRLSVSMPDADSLSIYDCSLPFSGNPGVRGVSLIVGINPPNPLTVDFAVANGFSSKLIVEAMYLEHPDPFTFDADAAFADPPQFQQRLFSTAQARIVPMLQP